MLTTTTTILIASYRSTDDAHSRFEMHMRGRLSLCWWSSANDRDHAHLFFFPGLPHTQRGKHGLKCISLWFITTSLLGALRFPTTLPLLAFSWQSEITQKSCKLHVNASPRVLCLNKLQRSACQWLSRSRKEFRVTTARPCAPANCRRRSLRTLLGSVFRSKPVHLIRTRR